MGLVADPLDELRRQLGLLDQLAKPVLEEYLSQVQLAVDPVRTLAKKQEEDLALVRAAFEDPLEDLRSAIQLSPHTIEAARPLILETMELQKLAVDAFRFPVIDQLGWLDGSSLGSVVSSLQPLEAVGLDFVQELTDFSAALGLPWLSNASFQWKSHLESVGAGSFQGSFGGQIATSVRRFRSTAPGEEDDRSDEELVEAVEEIEVTIVEGASEQPPVVTHSRRQLLANVVTLAASLLHSEWRSHRNETADDEREGAARRRHDEVVNLLQSSRRRAESALPPLTETDFDALAIVDVDRAKLMSRPAHDADILGVLAEGHLVQVIFKKDPWTKVIAVDWVGGVKAAGWLRSNSLCSLGPY